MLCKTTCRTPEEQPTTTTKLFPWKSISRHLKKETPSKQNVKDHKPYHRSIATSIAALDFHDRHPARIKARVWWTQWIFSATRGPNKIIEMLNFKTSFPTCCGHVWSIYVNIIYSLLYLCWMATYTLPLKNHKFDDPPFPCKPPNRGVKEVTNEVEVRQAKKKPKKKTSFIHRSPRKDVVACPLLVSCLFD